VKFLCLILAVCVIVLSTRPCCADYDCQGQAAAKKEHSQKTPAQEKECPGCSPFFACGSCVGFIVAKPVTFDAIAVTETPVTSYSGYQQPSVKEVLRAIWQPPKIS
jgi:hypothetical protein